MPFFRMSSSTLFVFVAILSSFLAESVSNCSPKGLDENQIALCNSPGSGLSTLKECNSRESWPSNTIVELRCRDGWKPTEDSTINNITSVCSNGEAQLQIEIDRLRQRHVLKCQEDCSWWDSVEDFNGVKSRWRANMAIFTEDFVGSGNFSQTCSGTLVSSRHILTAAQCMQYSFRRRTVFLRPQDIEIRTGTTDIVNQGISQHHPIEKIVIHEGYNPLNFESDLAIIALQNPIERTKFLHPICIATAEEESTDDATFGRLVTYNAGNYPQQKQLKRISSRKCRESNPAHENIDRGTTLCAGVPTDSSETCTHFGGSGYVSVAPNYTRLRGVRSGITQTCKEPIVFIRLSKYTDWINYHVHGINKSANVRSTSHPSTKEVPLDQPNEQSHDHQPNALSIQKKGSQKNALPAGTLPLNIGKPTPTTTTHNQSTTSKYDQKPELPNAQKLCPPLEPPEGSLISCRDSGGKTDCAEGGVLGSTATYNCKKYYSPVFGFDTIQRQCTQQGHWRPSAEFGCKLNCGVSSSPKTSFIVNGVISDRATWPWHATIFSNTTEVVWSYRCGGALISKNVILTAAHCVTRLGSTTLIPNEELLIVLGARSGDIFDNLGDPHAKVFHVKSVDIPDTYNAVTFNSDISLIQLSDDVELSDYIAPVCWPSRRSADHRILERIHLEYSNTIKGYAIGFGIDENGEIGKGLREAALPYVTTQACREGLDRTPTDSQFCAGYLNGTSVCNGDSGGGLYFADTTQTQVKYIIQGIVSNGDSSKGSTPGWKYCNNNNYAVFTRVINFSEWIHQFLDSIEENRSKRSFENS